NRLEYAIRGIDIGAENMQAAESRIRDADMAAEMVAYTKDRILAQAGNAMLAQANQKTQQVLQLLQ
ncbi:MAG TPA: flagellin, partial [Spirochaetales bacterium]|nr:flagellin [Spirochaetales bacterium]